MKQVCSSCHYIGEIIKPRYLTYKFPLAGILIALSINYFIIIFSNNSSDNGIFSFQDLDVFLFFPIVMLISGLYFLYAELKSKKLNKKSSLVFLILSIYMFVNGIFSFLDNLASNTFYRIPATIIYIAFGAISFYWYSYDWHTCPNCNKRKTLISIDKSEAQTIIKENNLTIPDDPVEPLEEPKPKMPWESN